MVLWGCSAEAVEDAAVARAHFILGQKAYDEGRFAGALSEFDLAYHASNRAELLYNIGLCHEKLGRFHDAVENFRRYLTALPAASDRAEVQERVRQLEMRLEEAAKLDRELTPAPLVAAPARRPIYKRAWFWGVIGGAVAVAALGVGLGVGLSSSSGDGFSPTLPNGGPRAVAH